MREWLRLAVSGLVVRQALFYAVVVGMLLAVINHGDAILHGDIDVGRIVKIALTCLVPYAVSTLSSVKALRASNSSASQGETSKAVDSASTEERKS